jgi:hypothetical protein
LEGVPEIDLLSDFDYRNQKDLDPDPLTEPAGLLL